MIDGKARVLKGRFFKTKAGNEPVREWLKGLPIEDKKAVGTHIKAVQIGWPLGMPLVRKMGRELWEIRVTLDKRIARIFFTIIDDEMLFLHGFIKKSNHTPQDDLALAKNRLSNAMKENR